MASKKISYIEIDSTDNTISEKVMDANQKTSHELLQKELSDKIQLELDKEKALEQAISKFVALGLSESDVRLVINNVNS